MATSSDQFRLTVNRVRAFIQRDAKTIIKNESLSHFRQSFQNEGFTDETLDPWPDITEKTKERKRRRNGSLPPILTDTGDLSRSLTGTIEGNDVVISSDLPYAERHNQGLQGMKKRQFMGASRQLERRITRQLDNSFTRLFGNLLS